MFKNPMMLMMVLAAFLILVLPKAMVRAFLFFFYLDLLDLPACHGRYIFLLMRICIE
jgi:hypothetical protein